MDTVDGGGAQAPAAPLACPPSDIKSEVARRILSRIRKTLKGERVARNIHELILFDFSVKTVNVFCSVPVKPPVSSIVIVITGGDDGRLTG